MKTIIINYAIILFAITFLASCATTDELVVETDAPTAVTTGKVQGAFKSVAGVMDELSCYCSNGGYVTEADGSRTAVCFDEGVDVDCTTIDLWGDFVTKSIESDGASPCPSGEMTFLHVRTFTCKSSNM